MKRHLVTRRTGARTRARATTLVVLVLFVLLVLLVLLLVVLAVPAKA